MASRHRELLGGACDGREGGSSVDEHCGVFFDWQRATLGRGATTFPALQNRKTVSNARRNPSSFSLQLAASIDVFTIDELNVEIDDGSLDGLARSSFNRQPAHLTRSPMQPCRSSWCAFTPIAAGGTWPRRCSTSMPIRSTPPHNHNHLLSNSRLN